MYLENMILCKFLLDLMFSIYLMSEIYKKIVSLLVYIFF